MTQSKSEAGKKIDEEDVWTEFKCGSRSAYAYIYRSNVQALFDYGMHVHADNDLVKDCMQELFVHIWQHKENLGKVKNIRGYLMVGLRRKIIDEVNSVKKTSTFMFDELREAAAKSYLSYENSSDDSSLQRENGLLHAIEKLPPRQKEILYLSFYKNLSHEEIVEIMSINGASVYTLTWKAIKALKSQLKHITILLLPFYYL